MSVCLRSKRQKPAGDDKAEVGQKEKKRPGRVLETVPGRQPEFYSPAAGQPGLAVGTSGARLPVTGH